MAIENYLQGIQGATAGAQQDVTAAAKDLAAVQVGGGSLPAKLREALNTKLNNNKDIINQQAGTMQAYFNAPSMAREKYQDVFNPFEKAKLVSQERTMALKPYDVLQGVLENRMGDVSEIVNAGVQGWQGIEKAAETKTQLAKYNLENALQQYLQASSMQSEEDKMAFQREQAEESKRQFEKNYLLEQYKATHTGGGTSGERETNDLKNMLASDAKSGVLLKTLVNTYANDLSLPDIIKTYNSNSSWGKKKETNDVVASWYTAAKKGQSETDPFAGMTANQRQTALVNVQPYATLVGQMENLKSKLEKGEIKTIPGKQLESPLLKLGLSLNKEDVSAYNAMQNMNARIVYLRSGKQINEQEMKRIADTMAQIGTLTGANIDRLNLLLDEFWDALGARGITRSNIGSYFPGAASNINNAQGGEWQ